MKMEVFCQNGRILLLWLILGGEGEFERKANPNIMV